MPRLMMVFDGRQEMIVRLRDDATDTTRELLSALPFESSANRWGDEVYFQTPVEAPIEGDARAVMSVGEVAYWPDGGALAMFFGRTPVSTDDRPRAYSPCNIVGVIEGDPAALKHVATGAKVRVERLE